MNNNSLDRFRYAILILSGSVTLSTPPFEVHMYTHTHTHMHTSPSAYAPYTPQQTLG